MNLGGTDTATPVMADPQASCRLAAAPATSWLPAFELLTRVDRPSSISAVFIFRHAAAAGVPASFSIHHRA